MLHTVYILAIKPNHTQLLSLRERRSRFYRSFGLPSALAFEPVIPIAAGGSAGKEKTRKETGETPFKKELFIGFSRSGGKPGGDSSGKNDLRRERESEKRKGLAESKMSRVPTGIPILSFSSLESFRENYYYPLTSPWIWNKFNRVLEQEGDKNAAVSPIPPFPGIFAYSREEGKASKAGPAGERTSNGIESKEKGKEAMGAPEPWQNYKLALFELQWEPSKKGKWWDGCSWREVWDLTLGNLNVEPV